MANRIQLRRGGSQEWANANPTLAQGELGIEIDTGRIKIGDGVSPWNNLRYERPIESVANSANTLVQRDPDGNFAAGSITASLIGNALTATKLQNSRQIQLTGDLTGSNSFDGSANLNISAQLGVISTLPHYDGTITSSGTYTKVTVDAKGRITNATTPNSLSGYGIDDAQPLDADLTAIAGLSTTGILVRASEGNMQTRTIVSAGTSRIVINNGSGTTANPSIDLALIPAASGNGIPFASGIYNTPTVASATQTLKASKIELDVYGRIIGIVDYAIATAVEGTTSSAWTTGTSYSRYAKVTNASKLYQALNSATAGATAPTHTSGDASDGAVSWRYLGAVTTRQKGLASFDQEDFDVDADGHVQIASAGVDNTQLQNNQIRFADGNSYTAYELDNELTASTGYRGITTINNLSVNTTGGSPLLKCLAADDNVDINTTTSTIFSDITLDKTSTAIQTINRSGSLTILMDANTASNRFLRLTANNAGAGEAKIEVTADEQISIISTNADVRVEDFYFADNVISSTNSTIVLDPAGIGDDTGVVQIKGNLQIDGTTTTVNSTTITVDDPIITLGGDTAPTSDDNKDRGIEFRYYDTQARLGFFGWDENYTTLSGTTGGYRFLYNATNTSEVFTGTDAGIIAGNLALSSNTGSTSTSTGTLVVTGGAGISQNLWIGGTTNVAGNTTLQGTLGVTDNVTLNKNVTIVGSNTAATEYFKIQNGSEVDKFVVDSSSGNTDIKGTLDVLSDVSINTNKFNITASSGDTSIAGTLGVTGATTLTGNLTTQSASLVNIQNTTNTNVTGAIAGTAYASLGTYGALKVDGGASIANGLVIGGSLKIYGQFDVDGAVSYSGATVFKNNISVDNDGISPYKFSVTASSGDISSSGTLTLTGTATFNSNVNIVGSNTAATEYFKIKNGSSVDKFVVDSSSGNTDIEGTLDVLGNVNINTNKFNVVASSGNTSIAGTLGVTGATTLSSTLGVTGLITANAGLTISGSAGGGEDFIITDGTNTKFSVLSASGNTSIVGTLGVTGATTLSSTLGVTGLITANAGLTISGSAGAGEDFIITDGTNTKFSVLSASGNTSISGTLTTTGATQLNNTLGVTGITSITNTTAGDTSSASYTTAGALRVSGGAGIAGGTSIGGDLRVYTNTTLDGTLRVKNSATFDVLVKLDRTSNPTAYTSPSALELSTGGAKIAGKTWIADDFHIWDTTNSRDAFVVTKSTGDASLYGSMTIGGNLIVNGTTTTINSTTITVDDPILTLGGDTNPVSDDNKDRGIEFRYFDTTAKRGFFGWDDSSLAYRFLENATNTSEVFTGTNAGIIAGDLSLSSNVSSTSTTTGTLVVTGGVGISQNVYIGGTLNSAGATTLSTTLAVTGQTTLTGLLDANGGAEIDNIRIGITDNNTIDTSTGNLTINSAGGTININDAASITGITSITNTTIRTIPNGASIPSLGGAFQVTGGAHIGGNFVVNGDLKVYGAAVYQGGIDYQGTQTYSGVIRQTNTTDAASATDTNASISTAGGLAIAKKLFVGTTLGVTGATTLSSTLGVTGVASVTNTTDATSTTSAALIVSGGVGIASQLRVGGNTTLTGTLTVNTTGSTFSGTLNAGTFSGSGASLTNIPNSATTATNANTASAIVSRDAGGNFSAGTITAALSGNATTATTLQTSRTFSISGDATASAQTFDGSANVSLPLVLSNTGVTAGTYSRVTVDAKGRVTAGTQGTYSSATYSGDGTKVSFQALTGRSVENIFAIVAGLVRTPTTEYTYHDQVILGSTGGQEGDNTIYVSSNTGLVLGMPVSGTGIGSGAVITNISGTTITLSANNTSPLKKGNIATINTIAGTTNAGAPNATYTAVASTTTGSGIGATFTVTRNAQGAIATVTIVNAGKYYVAGNQVRINGTLVGGSSGTDDVTFNVATTTEVTTTATFAPVVKFATAPSSGTNNVSLRYLPL